MVPVDQRPLVLHVGADQHETVGRLSLRVWRARPLLGLRRTLEAEDLDPSLLAVTGSTTCC